MTYDKAEIVSACVKIAPKHGFEPIQLYALARQESAKTKDGHFDASIPRLEQGFLERYVLGNLDLPKDLPTTTLGMLATSYGCWQIMGYELWRLKWMQEYFDNLENSGWKDTLKSPYSQISVQQSLDDFCMDIDAQCDYACKLLNEKRNTANRMDSFKNVTNKEELTFLLWNGGSDTLYGKKVLKWKDEGL